MAATATTTPATPAVRTPVVVASSHHPFADPKNTITYHTGPQYQFSLSEGIYTLRDEIALGIIAPHPLDGTIQSSNVLDTKPLPPTSGTRLTLAILAPRKPTSFTRRSLNIPTFKSSFLSSFTESSGGSSKHSSDQGSSKGPGSAAQTIPKSKFGEGNTALFPANAKESKDPLKRRKPKNSINKSSSSFLSRTIVSDNLSKRIQEHNVEGTYAFANIGRGFLWLDLSSQNKQDQMTKILFTKAHALCHDFNEFTKTPSHIDMIIGFNTSEIIWYEPISQKYTRLNKNGLVNSTPISQVKWLPGSENLFIAAHLDGTLVVYDKEKDEGAYVPEETNGMPTKVSTDGRRLPRLIVKKSVQSKTQKLNPISVWKATNQRINAMAFSPDGKLLALACEDGSLRILDYINEELTDLYRSYYGGLTCVCWSPDGAYLLTGGQDDLVSIWSLFDRSLVARCVGHKSWVSYVAFDPWHCDESTYRFGSVGEDGRLLIWDFSSGTLNQPRAASLRQSISSYAAPASTSATSTAPISSSSSSYAPERSASIVTLTQQHHSFMAQQAHAIALANAAAAHLDGVSKIPSGAVTSDGMSTPRATGTPNMIDHVNEMGDHVHATDNDNDNENEVTHAVLPRSAVAMLPPVLSKEVDSAHALSWLAFEEDTVFVVCKTGHVQSWARPKRTEAA